MIVLLIGVITLSMADLIVTIAHLRTIGLAEANPIAAFLIRSTESSWILAAYKCLTVGICVSLLYRARRYFVGELATWCALLALAVMSVMWHAYTHELDGQFTQLQASFHGDKWLRLD